jgi:hypothetical protein
MICFSEDVLSLMFLSAIYIVSISATENRMPRNVFSEYDNLCGHIVYTGCESFFHDAVRV